MAEATKRTIATVLEGGRWLNRLDGERLPRDFQRRIHAEKVAEGLAAKDGLVHEIYGNRGELVSRTEYSKPRREGGIFGWFALGAGGGISSLFH